MKSKELKGNSLKNNGKFLSLKNDFNAWLLLLPAVLCIYFFTLRPQIMGMYWSFFDMKGFNITEFVGLDNYKRVLSDTAFLKTFANTWMYVFWSIVVGFIIPFVVAIILDELMHLRNFTRVLVYLPAVMPVAAVSLLWYFVYYPDETGLLNSIIVKLGGGEYSWLQDGRFTILYIIITMTWAGMGGTAIYYFSGLQGVNRELYEAAIIDGAGFFKRIFTITIPQMSGMLILFFIRQIIAVFNVIEQPMQMTGGGPNNASITLGLLNYRYGFVLHRPQFAMALGVIMFLILSVFTVIYFKVDKKLEDSRM